MSVPIRVLYIDDSAHDRELVMDALTVERGGYQVTLAASRAEFENALKELSFDIVLSDFNILGFEGIQVLDAVARDAPDLPVIIVTGTGSEEIAVQAMKRGASDYVIKTPDHIRRLPLVIRAVLEHQHRIIEMREAQERLRYQASLVENVTDAVISTDMQFNIRSWNNYAELIYGWTAIEAIGKNLNELIPITYLDTTPEEVLKHFAQHGYWHGEVIQKRQDGQSVNILASVSAIRDEKGQAVGLVAINRDYTEVKHSQAHLRLQSAALEAAANGIAITNRQGIIEWVNPAFTQLTGYTFEEAVGKTHGQLLSSGKQDKAFYQRMWETILSGDVWRSEIINRHKDGSLYTEEESITPLVNRQGQITNFISIKQDISERKRSEQLVQARLNLIEYARSNTMYQILQYSLDVIGELTNSPIGFYHFVDDDQINLTLQAWSTRTLEEFCTIEGHGLHYPVDEAGIWADCVRTGKAVIHNDYPALTDRKGLPEGHAQVLRELVVPITRAGKIVAILGLGNKPTLYTKEDQNLVAYFADITWELVTTKRIEESLVRYRLLAGHASDAMLFVRPHDGAILDTNRAAEELYGFNADEMRSMTVYELRVPEARDVASIQIRQAATQGIRFETTHLRKDGTRIPVEVSSHAAEIEGEPVLLSIIRDISDRKAAEAEAMHRMTELEALNTISANLRIAQTSADMLPLFLDESLKALHIDSGAIWRYSRTDNKLYIDVARGVFVALQDQPFSLSGTFFEELLDDTKSLHDLQLPGGILDGDKLAAYLPEGINTVCLPLRSDVDVVGVMCFAVPHNQLLSPTQTKLMDALAEMAGTALNRLRLHEQTRQRLENLQALQLVDRAITSSLDIRLVLDVVLEQTMARLGVDAAAIMLLNPHSLYLTFAAGRGFRSKLIERSHIRLGDGLAGEAALHRKVISEHNINLKATHAVRKELILAEGASCYHVAPLISKGEVKGVLEVYVRTHMETSEEWLNFFEALATQTAIAIDNTQLFEGMQRSNLDLALAYDATIEGWSKALDLRDKETEGHTQRVTEMTVRMAALAGMSDAEIVHVRRGALLHDIGKMGVPDSILLKPGPLTDEEWVIMRRHTDYAHDLLSPVAYLRPALDIPICHHEKWDGSGYPRGLKGEQIPLSARLFAVVDVWDALRSDRPYRLAWPEDKALAYLREQTGTHFDPKAVEMFLRMLKDYTGGQPGATST